MLEHFEDLADQLPELEETVATSLSSSTYLSEVIETAELVRRGQRAALRRPRTRRRSTRCWTPGLALEAIDDYAVTECVGEVDDTDTEGTTVSTDS